MLIGSALALAEIAKFESSAGTSTVDPCSLSTARAAPLVPISSQDPTRSSQGRLLASKTMVDTSAIRVSRSALRPAMAKP